MRPHDRARPGVIHTTMPLHKRFLDMLPVMIVFAAVAAFGTYVAVAYVLQDPWWLHTLAAHQQPAPATTRRGPG